MIKVQKMWFWISVVVFFIPEIFFSFITSFVYSLLRVENFHFLYEHFIDPQFFTDNPVYLFIALAVEFLGALSILIWNIKFNKGKFRIFFGIIMFLITLLLVFIFFVGYSITHMSFP